MSDFYPGFDVASLSDEEIREKLEALQQRFISAHMMHMSSEVINQLQSYIQLLEFEQYNRHMIIMSDMFNKQFPDIIETDADPLEAPAKKKAEAKNTKKEQSANKPVFNKVYRQK